MWKDRKIKKIIRECTKPEKSFEQFCAENGIELPDRTTQTEKESGENTSKEKRRKPLWIALASAAAAVVLVLGICLPFLLSNDTPEYKASQAEGISITAEEVQAVKDIFIPQYSSVNKIAKIVPKGKSEPILAYNFEKMACDFTAGSTAYSYSVNYMARLYHKFAFAEVEKCTNAQSTVTSDDIQYNVRVNDGKAYVWFEKKGQEYFVTVLSHNQAQTVDAAAAEILIRNVL